MIGMLFSLTALSTDYAIVVGINQYRYLKPLKYPIKDAEQIGRLLEHYGYKTTYLIEERLSEGEILGEIDYLSNFSKEEDTLFFFFSGHGLYGETQDERGLMTFYTNPERANSVVTQSELSEALSAFKGRKMVVLDACFQGVDQPKMQVENDMETSRGLAGVADLLITSSSAQEKASDGFYFGSRYIENGVAAFFVRKALEGEADFNRDMALSASEIEEYLKRFAVDYANLNSQSMEIHTGPEAADELVSISNPSDQLEPLDGVIHINSINGEATVFVNGEKIGKPPLALEKKPGNYEIACRLEGHLDEKKYISLRPGATERVMFKLKERIDPENPPEAGWNYPRGDTGNSSYYPFQSKPGDYTQLSQKWAMNIRYPGFQNHYITRGISTYVFLTGDVDVDPYLEIVFLAGPDRIQILDHKGGVLNHFRLPYEDILYIPQTGFLDDVDDDLKKEIGTGERRLNQDYLTAVFQDSDAMPALTFRSPELSDSTDFFPAHRFEGGDILFVVNSESRKGVARYTRDGVMKWFYDPGLTVKDVSVYNDEIIGLSVYTAHFKDDYTEFDLEEDDEVLRAIVIDAGGVEIFNRVGFYNHDEGQSFSYVDDFDNDGDWELLVQELHSETYYSGVSGLYLLDKSGEVKYSYKSIEDSFVPYLAFADLNNDGKKEIVYTARSDSCQREKGTIEVFNSNLERLHRVEDAFVQFINDIDGDGNNEIVAKDGTRVLIMDRELNELFTYDTDHLIETCIVSDIDRDGVNDILVFTHSRLFCLTME